jgi:hypothetical protein
LEAAERDHKPGYLDSKHDAAHRQDTKEFNRRLIALKEKYGVK